MSRVYAPKKLQKLPCFGNKQNQIGFLIFFSILCTLTVDVLVYADIKSRIKYYNSKVDQCEKQTITI